MKLTRLRALDVQTDSRILDELDSFRTDYGGLRRFERIIHSQEDGSSLVSKERLVAVYV